MRFKFKDKKLERLYTSEEGAHKFPNLIVKRFFEVVATITAVPDIRDLYNLKGLRFKKLRRDPTLHSMRLNQQYRLLVTIQRDGNGQFILILEIDDHQDD